MKAGAATGCHQMYERSFHVKGFQFPLCVRCTGLVIGQFLGLVLFFTYIKFDFLILLSAALISILILGIDWSRPATRPGSAARGLGQLRSYLTSNNFRRLITGLTCGFFVASAFVKLICLIFIF